MNLRAASSIIIRNYLLLRAIKCIRNHSTVTPVLLGFKKFDIFPYFAESAREGIFQGLNKAPWVDFKKSDDDPTYLWNLSVSLRISLSRPKN